MFLAGKVEETPRPLKDVILISYEVIHKKDPAAVARIKQKVRYFTEHCLGTSYLVASAILVSQVPILFIKLQVLLAVNAFYFLDYCEKIVVEDICVVLCRKCMKNRRIFF
jgi:hypothetical protein